MIRTADAAGFSAVILLGETADIYSPKVMRSMQGSNFHLPLVRMAKEDCFAQLKKAGISILTTTLSANSVSYKIINEPHFALIMGNEGPESLTKPLKLLTNSFILTCQDKQNL